MALIIAVLVSLLACGFLYDNIKHLKENNRVKTDVLKDQLDLTTAEFKKLAQEKEELEKKLHAVEIAEGKEGVQTARLDDINISISNKNEELSQLREQWTQLNESVGKLNEWRDQQQEAVKELGVQREELETLLSQLRLQVQGSRNELNSVGNELNRLLEMRKVTEKENNDVW